MQGVSEIDFVDPPQKQFQIECPICLEILCEPQIVSCCGNSFCQVCIERIRRDSRPCPLCKKPGFTIMANQGLKRALYDFQVRCPHRELGCTWQGELRSLRPHLNVNSPSPERLLEGCPYTKLKCAQCGVQVKRLALQNHRDNRCPRRPHTCEYCKEYRSTFRDVSCKHWAECERFPLPCPNNCDSKLLIERRKLDYHVKNECPLTLVPCTLQYAGCKTILYRKCLRDHIKEELLMHLSLLAAENETLRKELHEKCEHLQHITEANSELIVNLEQKQKEQSQDMKRIQSLSVVVSDIACWEQRTAQLVQRFQELQEVIHDAEIKHLTEELSQLRKDLLSITTQQKASEKRSRVHSQILFILFLFLVPIFLCWVYYNMV